MTLVALLALSGCNKTQPYVPRFANLSESSGFEVIWTGDRIAGQEGGFHEYWLYGASDSFKEVRVQLADDFRAAGWKTWPPNSTDDGWDRVIGAIHPSEDFCVVYQDFERSYIYSPAIAVMTEDDLRRASAFPSRIFVELTDQCA